MTDALKLAADAGDLKEVKRLVEEENVPVTQADEWGDTALHAAVAKGRSDIVLYLLKEKQVNPNIQNKAGSTPLHKGAVAKFEQLQILRILLEYKADPLIRNSNGLLPEQLAPGDLAKKILAGDDFVEEVIDVHRSKHGRIIGKGGSKMKQVQSESGAHVTIPKQSLNSDKITLKGRREAVDKAKQLILDLVKGEGEGEGGDESKMSTKLQVPKDKHRLIIGRGGATVNEIREEANVEIIIPPANSRDEDIIIKSDNPDNITLAIKKIQEITGSSRSAPPSFGGAGGGGGRRGSNGNNFPSLREGRSTPEGGNRRGTPEGGSRAGRGGKSG
eukprot:Phypoly_transcript_13686.p1 GENE.Phypoly_transcript_13686~~Phypoly_transcript_13686.p1  ORF type:complete len:347 (+),score=81.48 Phypoly_transcript_13686:51-1043(+)